MELTPARVVTVKKKNQITVCVSMNVSALGLNYKEKKHSCTLTSLSSCPIRGITAWHPTAPVVGK